MKIVALLFMKFASRPIVQKFLYTPWFGKVEQAETVSRPQSAGQRISHVDDDREGYAYDEDARLRGELISPPRVENGNGGYLVANSGTEEHERLLRSGQEWDNVADGRRDHSGTLQPSGLR